MKKLLSMSKRTGLLVVLLMAGGLVIPESHAQAPADGYMLDLEEVIVSARRRDERLQDVPLAITAVTAEKIVAAGIDNVTKLSSMTPGFYYESSSGTRQSTQARIRGMNVNTTNPTQQNASFYIDGVYLPGSTQGLDFSEFERIEIIKGPQSAAFGRQTFGGAVNFITKQPTNVLSLDGAANFGSNGLVELTGSVSGALVEDQLFARASVRSYDYGGKYRNVVDGKRLGERETRSGSVVVSWRPLDNLSFDLRYAHAEDDDGPPAVGMVGSDELNCGPFFPGGYRAYCGALPKRNAYAVNSTVVPNAAGFKKFGFTRETDMTIFTSIVSLAQHDVTLTAAKYKEHSESVSDIDLTGIPAYAQAYVQDFDDKSAELRVTSTGDGRLNYIVGVYWYDGNFKQSDYGLAGDLSNFPATVPPNIYAAESISAFGSVGYAITERVTASAELRYQDDKVTNIGGVGAQRRTLSTTTDAWLPRLIVDYKPTDDLMVYAIYSMGNKPAQFNANIAGLPQDQQDYIWDTYGVGVALKEEKLSNYEFGVKSSWLDHRLTANASLFFMDWEDQATRGAVFVAPGDANQINVVLNAGSSEIKGIELDSSFAVTSALVLEGSVSYIQSKYKHYESAEMGLVFGDREAAGQESASFPKIQGALAATYSFPLPGGWDGALRVDELYMGKRWTDITNLAYADKRWRTNLRATASRGPFSVTAYVDNLTDDDGLEMAGLYRDVTAPVYPWPFSYPFVRSEGRKVGLTLRYSR